MSSLSGRRSSATSAVRAAVPSLAAHERQKLETEQQQEHSAWLSDNEDDDTSARDHDVFQDDPLHKPAAPAANSSRQRQPPPAPYVGAAASPILETEEETKEAGNVDWYAEGPGRRVGYDDFTSIDWIFEYARERQRLRLLASTAKGLAGNLKQALDSSQIWVVLILTGLATGAIAACIDIASDWLADLKTGYCRSGGPGGGEFYLNRAFCCWGLDDYASCQGWIPWNRAFSVDSQAGSWMLRYAMFSLFSVTFAACASFLVIRYSLYAKQSGIPEIKMILGGFVMRNFLEPMVLLIKSIGLCLSVASGLWLGKEGPLVHVACCCAALFLQPFRVLNENEATKREVLSAAAAAGISVAFGAPVGGVLFSLEQLSHYFPDKTMWQSFGCAMIAAVTLQVFNPFRTGNLVLYQVTYSTGWHAFEVVPFALLGILGGLYGAAFIKLNMLIARWRKSSRFFPSPLLEVIAVALVTALVNFPNKFMRAQSTELVATLFSECSELRDEQLGLCGRENTTIVFARLVSASLLGLVLTSATFGLQIPAGIILPSMAVGSLYGRAVGLLMREWQHSFPNLFLFSACEPDVPCVTAGTYAIIGAASALGGATRMTISIVVITFELTGALTYVLPIMVSVMLSKWVGDAFGQRGIYESWIRFNSYPYLDNRDDAAAAQVPDVPSASLMTRVDDLVLLPATGLTIAAVEEQFLNKQRYRGFPVVKSLRDPLLLGYISRTELAYAVSSAKSAPRMLSPSVPVFFSHQASSATTTLDLRPWMDQTPLTLAVGTNLQLAVNLFMKLGLRYVLFVERGRLKGLLTKKDVWMLLNEGDLGTGRSAAQVRELGTVRTSEEERGEGTGLLDRQ